MRSPTIPIPNHDNEVVEHDSISGAPTHAATMAPWSGSLAEKDESLLDAFPALSIEEVGQAFPMPVIEPSVEQRSSPLERYSIFSSNHVYKNRSDSDYASSNNTITTMDVNAGKSGWGIEYFKEDLKCIKRNKSWLQGQGLTLDYLPEKSTGLLLNARIQKADGCSAHADDLNLSQDYQQCLQTLCCLVFGVSSKRDLSTLQLEDYNKVLEQLDKFFSESEIYKASKAKLYFENCVEHLSDLIEIDLKATQSTTAAAIRGLLSAITVLKVLESDFEAKLNELNKHQVTSEGVKLITNNKSWLLEKSIVTSVLSEPIIDLLRKMDILPTKEPGEIDSVPDLQSEYEAHCRFLFVRVMDLKRSDSKEVTRQYGYYTLYDFITGYFDSLAVDSTSHLSDDMDESLAWVNQVINVDLIAGGQDDDLVYDEIKETIVAILIIKTLGYCFDGEMEQLELESVSEAECDGDSGCDSESVMMFA